MPRNPRADQIGMGGRMLSVQVGGSSRNTQLSKCTNPSEMSAVHSEFYKEAAESYQREFAEMAELGQQAIGQLGKIGQAGTNQQPTKKG